MISSSSDHAARGLGAVGLGLHLHAGRRRADAARRQHALAFDLDHADAAIAVRPVAGLRARSTGAACSMPTGARRPARWSRRRGCLDLAAVEREGDRRFVPCPFVAHDRHQCPSGLVSSSGKVFQHAQQRIGRRLAEPADRGVAHQRRQLGQQRLDPTGPVAISLTAFSVPTRQGVHWPQLSSSKNFIRLSATAFMSSLLGQDHNRVRPDEAAVFLERAEIERHSRPSRPAGCRRRRRPADSP